MDFRITKLLVTVLVLSLTIGCASMMRGSEQQIHVNAYDAKTGNIVSADCILSNDEGTFRTKSNRAVIIGRDKDYLTVDCQNEELAGRTVVDGKVNWGYWAIDFFAIDLCIVSCWIDGLSGSWAEYPTMIDVPMDPKK
jgi:hypothetical protein